MRYPRRWRPSVAPEGGVRRRAPNIRARPTVYAPTVQPLPLPTPPSTRACDARIRWRIRFRQPTCSFLTQVSISPYDFPQWWRCSKRVERPSLAVGSTLRGYPGDHGDRIISAREAGCAVRARLLTPDKTGWSRHHCLRSIAHACGWFGVLPRRFSQVPGSLTAWSSGAVRFLAAGIAGSGRLLGACWSRSQTVLDRA
jgi:hypothetical protein